MESYVTFSNGVITDIDKSFNGCLTLSQINGEDIIEIDDSACMSGKIRGLDISKTKIDVIRSSAFCFCYSLVSVELPETITSLGYNVFAHCNFSYIRIPKSLVSMNGWAFNQAQNIMKIDVDENNPRFTSVNGFLLDKDLTTIVVAPQIDSQNMIPNNASITKLGPLSFISSRLKNLQLKLNITEIGEHSFAVTNLRRIDLRKTSIRSLPEYCFRDSYYLKEIYLPESLEQIYAEAFRSTAIKYISFPPSVSSVQDNLFQECKRLIGVIYFGENDFSKQNFLVTAGSYVTPKVYVTNKYPTEKFGGIQVSIGAYEFGISQMKCSAKYNTRNKLLIKL